MPSPSLNVPTPEFPVVGNSFPVAVAFMLHIAIASYSVGAIAIAPFMELRALRTGDPKAVRYARALTNSYYLVFSLGATLAVFAVVLVTGLWARAFGDLVNVFLPLVAVLFGLFLILAPLLVLYRNTFLTMRPVPHIALGFAVLFWQALFVVGITALDAYLIAPRHAGLLEGALNPPYVPLLLHRLMGSVSWTALFLAGYAALRLGVASTEEERVFQAWAARVNLRIGLLVGALMPVGGFVLVEVLKSSQMGFFDNLVRGQAAWLFVVQEVLVAGILVFGNVALALEAPPAGRADSLGRMAVVACATGSVVGVMPAAVIPDSVLWLRYAGLGIAVAATLVHLLARSFPRAAMPRLAPAPGAAVALPYTETSMARRALVAVGLLGVTTALFMGYMKEEARGSYTFYGELTQQDAHGPFNPSPGLYP